MNTLFKYQKEITKKLSFDVNIGLTIPERSPRYFLEDFKILDFHFVRRFFFLSLDLKKNEISARAEIFIWQGVLFLLAWNSNFKSIRV